MKTNFIYFIIFFASCAYGQIPNGYYDATENQEGYVLKTTLSNIIKDFNTQSYSALKSLYASTAPKNGYRDRYYESDHTVLDIYSENPDGPDPYNYNPDSSMGSGANEGDAFNREHLIPQSYFNQNLPMRSDAFHVWPADSKVNSWRGNDAFGKVNNPQSATPCNNGGTNLPCKSKNGTLKGKFVENTSITVMEPIDEFKGDIARAFLYFATCYEDKMPQFYTSSSAGVKVMFDGTKNKVFSDSFLELLVSWHLMDPPSQRERDMNNLVYYSFQGNRNPFIDHPEFVSQIWGIGLDTQDFEYQLRKDILTYTNVFNEVVLRLENPEKSMDIVYVYDTQGRLIHTQKNILQQHEMKIKLPKGIYILKVEGKRLEFNTRVLLK